jgi:NitT/TauT family transport system substrate-binding protein
MKAWIVRRGVAALGVLALAAAAATAQTPVKVRVATLPADVSAQAFYAADQGFFKQAGLDVDVTVMRSGPAIAAGISSGDIDFGASNSLTLALAHEHGLPFVMVAPAGAYQSKLATTKLFVVKGSPIKKASDLNGKTVAINSLGQNIASIGDSFWIDRNGGDSKSVKFVEIPFSEMPVALTTGRVDAANMDELGLSRADGENLRVLATPYDAISKEWLQGAWFTTAQFARAHPDIVAKFAAVMAKTADWANKNQAESAKILERYTKVAIAPGTPRVFYPPWLVRGEVMPLLDAAQKYGALKPDFDVGGMLAPGVTFR